MPAGPVSRSWRRYLRFSVRALMVLVIGTGLGWIVRGARIQREAVAAIESDGGDVSYRSHIHPSTIWWPNWLEAQLGIDYLDPIAIASLLLDCTDADMAHVGRLSDLTCLGLRDSGVTDAGFVHLKGLTSLRKLFLDSCHVSDVGLEHLRGLVNLMELDLRNTQVTDSGLAQLKGLKSLWKLDLSGTQVTDAGITHLKSLANLKYILLDGTQVTDAGVQELKQALPSLTIFR